MADISKQDIKLMASQVLADTEDGGGQMTSNEIVSGNVNNLFPDISRLDRTYGRVSMRKAYIAVRTDNRATYFGSHVALTEQAEDPLVNTTLFTTEDWFDRRESCQKRIEGYLVKGPIYACALWGDHYEGSRSVTVFTEEGWPLPENGEVFVIIKTRDLNGATITAEEQFLRITKIESEIREFTDSNDGKYKKQIITLTFGNKIKFDLKGSSPTRAFSYGDDSTRGTVFHTSVAADTSKYYGVSKLVEPAGNSELSIRVDEIRKPLVPSTTSQAAVTDFGVGTLREAVISSSGDTESKITVSRSLSVSSGNNTLLTGMGIKHGSLELDVSYVGSFTDNGKGDLLDESSAVAGVVNYASGEITFQANSSTSSSTADITFYPAAPTPAFTESGSIAIQEQNRGYTYVFNCTPSPVRGTIKIDFLSSGKWYSLYDQGTGELKGLEDGVGSGSVNFDTGSVSMTLGGMPDIGSMILIYWGTPVFTMPLRTHLENSEELTKYDTLNPPVTISGELPSLPKYGTEINFTFPVSEGSYRVYGTYDQYVQLSYEYITSDSTVYSGPCGYIKASWSGESPKNYIFTPKLLPESVSTYNISFTDKEVIEEAISVSYASSLTIALNNTGNLAPNHLRGNLTVLPESLSKKTAYTYIDRGTGEVKSTTGSNLTLRQVSAIVGFYDDGSGNIIHQGTDGDIIGSVDYTTGEVTLQGDYVVYFQADRTLHTDEVSSWHNPDAKNTRTEELVTVEQVASYEGGSAINFNYRQTDSAENSISSDNSVSEEDLSVEIPKLDNTVLMAGSVVIKHKGTFYLDDGLGKLRNASSDQIFSINYSTGKITSDNLFEPFSLIDSAIDDIRGVLIAARDEITYQWKFRTPGAPITPSSFTIQATTNEGQIIETTGDFDGNLESTEIHGIIEYDTGIVDVLFGVWTPIPAGEENEEWLNDYMTDGSGNYLEPLEVQTKTITMNCVVETHVPLDADLLGLNPVKLPIDGKVPIYRDGDIVLIHHSQTDVISSPSAGQTVTLSRSNVNLIELYDNDGVYIPELGNYSVDLSAGTLTFEDPLDLSAYSSPFQAVNRIEDMVLTTDVQITGHMTLSQPLQHSYPADETLVSSVLPIGDVQARIYNVFTDSSWNNSWSDERQYGPTTAQYDLVNYPLVTKNKSSVKERFALVFTSSNTVDVVGEHLGVILSDAPITSDIAPINPATGEAYFTIRHEGWGDGWSAGQVLRFNSDAGNFPVWFCRTTQQGPATENSDDYVIQIRGDSS